MNNLRRTSLVKRVIRFATFSPLLLVIIFQSGCTSGKPNSLSSPKPTDAVVQICDAIISASGETVNSALASFGEPSNIDTENVASPHDSNLINKRAKLSYGNGYIFFYELPKYQKSYLVAAKYTSHFNAPTFSDVFGQNSGEIRRRFGKENRLTGTSLFYYCANDNYASLSFQFENDALTAIVLSVWLD